MKIFKAQSGVKFQFLKPGRHLFNFEKPFKMATEWLPSHPPFLFLSPTLFSIPKCTISLCGVQPELWQAVSNPLPAISPFLSPPRTPSLTYLLFVSPRSRSLSPHDIHGSNAILQLRSTSSITRRSFGLIGT